MRKTLKKIYSKFRSILGLNITRVNHSSSVESITEFKSNFWQTEEGANGFRNGSDASSLGIAKLMDIVLNDIFLEHSLGYKKVLDIGSGHGIVSLFFAEKGFEVTACDISQNLLNTLGENAKKKNLKITIRRGKVQNIPAETEEFDVIVSRMFLPHFPDWQNLMTEISRCCKKGGKIMIHFTSKENSQIAPLIGTKQCSFSSTDETIDGFYYYAEGHQEQINKVCRKNNLKFIHRIPVTGLYSNRIIGSVLGTEKYNQFHKELAEHLKDSSKLEFMIWLEKSLISQLPVSASFSNVLILEKE